MDGLLKIISNSIRNLKLKGAKNLEYFDLAGECSFQSLDFSINTRLKKLCLDGIAYVPVLKNTLIKDSSGLRCDPDVTVTYAK